MRIGRRHAALLGMLATLVHAGACGSGGDGTLPNDGGTEGGADAARADGGGDATSDAGRDVGQDGADAADVAVAKDGAVDAADAADAADANDAADAAIDASAVDAGVPVLAEVSTLGTYTCARWSDGALKCWGYGAMGALGLGDTSNRGDGSGEMGTSLPLVNLGTGRSAIAIATGYDHMCAILDNHRVKCWGSSGFGQLGQGDTQARGDGAGEMGDALPYVDLGTGRTAKAIAAGHWHTCAILDNDTVKCWGWNNFGQLGLGDKATRGDGASEMGDALAAVSLGTGRTAKAIALGHWHSCALLDNDAVKCWGSNGGGQLGQGDTNDRGDGSNELGDALAPIDLGSGRTAKSISAGGSHTCAVLDNATLKCWGNNSAGELGLGDKSSRGDGVGEMGSALPAIDVGAGRTVKSVSAGYDHTCAILDDGQVKCWGDGLEGKLGLGDTATRGDGAGEMGASLPAVALGTGRTAKALAASEGHTCALLDNGALKCWGRNAEGELGLGDVVYRGDNGGEMGDALPAIDLGR